MKNLPVLIEFQGTFTKGFLEKKKVLLPKPENVSYCETLFFKEEYDYTKIISLLRIAIIYSNDSPQCLFQDSHANDYLTYEISCDWKQEGNEFKNILWELFEITGVYVEDYLVNRLCSISISYPKSWDDNEPEFWKKVYAGG